MRDQDNPGRADGDKPLGVTELYGEQPTPWAPAVAKPSGMAQTPVQQKLLCTPVGGGLPGGAWWGRTAGTSRLYRKGSLGAGCLRASA